MFKIWFSFFQLILQLTVVCSTLFDSNLEWQQRAKRASNQCTAEKLENVQRCLSLHTDIDAKLAAFEPNKLLFADDNERHLLIAACSHYDLLVECDDMLNSEAYQSCVNGTNVRDSLLYTYACELLLPMVEDSANADCWTQTKACDFNVLSKSVPKFDSSKFPCQILLSAYKQLKCTALVNDHQQCALLGEEIVGRALTETEYILSDHHCNLDKLVQTVTSPNLATVSLKNSLCKTLNEYSDVYCLPALQDALLILQLDANRLKQNADSFALNGFCSQITSTIGCFKRVLKQNAINCFVDKLSEALLVQASLLCGGDISPWLNRTSNCDNFDLKIQPQDPCYFEPQNPIKGDPLQAICALSKTTKQYIKCTTSRETPYCTQNRDSDISRLQEMIDQIMDILTCNRAEQVDGQISTLSTDETISLPSESCSPDEMQAYIACMNDFSQYGIHPVSVINNVSEIDLACKAFNQFFKCKRGSKCRPAIDGGIHNMFYYVCGTRLSDFKQQRDCLGKISETNSIVECVRNSSFTINELFNMDESELCQASNNALACAYRRVERKCGVDSADFQFLIMQSFAKGVNLSCPIEKPPKKKDTFIAFPVNCTEHEEMLVTRCADQFNGMTERLKDLVGQGLPHVLKSVDELNDVFYGSCAKMRMFDQCWNQSFSHDSNCKISSCLISVGLTVCRSNEDSDLLRDQLKCSFSLVAEPDFSKCVLSMPRNTWNDPAALSNAFPKFISCIQEPLNRKCGPNAVKLVRSLINEVLMNPYDSSCVVNFEHLREPFQSKAKPEISLLQELSKEDLVAKLREFIWYPQENDPRKMCTIEEYINALGCHSQLQIEDIQIENVFIDAPHILNSLCRRLEAFSNCTTNMPCRFPDDESWQNLLTVSCTSHREQMDSVGQCLTKLNRNGKMLSICQSERKPAKNREQCPWSRPFFLCTLPMVASQCSPQTAEALRYLYSIYARPYGPECILNESISTAAVHISDMKIGTNFKVISSGFDVTHKCSFQERIEFPSCFYHFGLHDVNVKIFFLDFKHLLPALCDAKDTFVNCTLQRPCLLETDEAWKNMLINACDVQRERAERAGACLDRLTAGEHVLSACDGAGSERHQSIIKICPTERDFFSCSIPIMATHCSAQEIDDVQFFYNTYLNSFDSKCSLSSVDNETTAVADDSIPSLKLAKVLCNNETDAGPYSCYEYLPTEFQLEILLFDGPWIVELICKQLPKYSRCLDEQSCSVGHMDGLRDALQSVCEIPVDDFKEPSICLANNLKTPADQRCLTLAQNLLDKSFKFAKKSQSCIPLTELLECVEETVKRNCTPEATDLMYKLYNSYMIHVDVDCLLPRESSTSSADVDAELSMTTDVDVENVTVYVQPKCDDLIDFDVRYLEDCSSKVGSDLQLNQIVFDGKSITPNVCQFLDQFVNCTEAQPCRTRDHDALKEILRQFCMLEPASFNPIARCLSEFYHSEQERTENDEDDSCMIFNQTLAETAELFRNPVEANRTQCPALGISLQCMARRLASRCSYESLKLIYELYNSYANWFGSECALDIRKIQRPPVACTTSQDKGFVGCQAELFKHHMNPITFIGNPETMTTLCVTFSGPYRTCLASLNCTPEPYAHAFYETLSFLCYNESLKSDFTKYGKCLGSAISSVTADNCDASYDDIIWSGVLGAKVNPCLKLSSILNCITDVALESCGEESVDLLYRINDLFMERYDPKCSLERPVLTTTGSTTTIATTTTTTLSTVTQTVEEDFLDTQTQTDFTATDGIEHTPELHEIVETTSTTTATPMTTTTTMMTTTTEVTKTTPAPIMDKTTPMKKPDFAAPYQSEDANASCIVVPQMWILTVSLLISIVLFTSVLQL
ncbi:Uncharacterized protein T10_9737 [Trichinella papuae]|uniref:T20D4.11-like domain-containing protein n=1 Tax=Trichinella papuae TaxID=268474 RepID=A0A0V1N3M3_9BILA|nr:Uncharacterized protein T10_9737 [Trichinella papuae]